MLSVDYFHDVKGEKNKTSEYHKLTKYIWREMCEKYVNTTNSLKDCLDSLSDFEKFTYNMLYGDVQSGKSLAIALMAWYSSFITVDTVPIIITKKLGNVRNDFVDKISDNGLVNKMVKRCIEEFYVDKPTKFREDVYKYFQLKSLDYFKAKNKNQMRKMGEVLILLMEPANFQQCIKEFNGHCKQNKKTLVMIDEMHEMYSTNIKERPNGLSEEQLKGFKNSKMMYWLHEQWKDQKLYVMGISATPLRACVDRDVYPSVVHKLTSDVLNETQSYRNIDKMQHKLIRNYEDETIVETILKIEAIPFFIDDSGVSYIKVVLLNRESHNVEQDKLKTVLEERTGMIVRIVNMKNDSIHMMFNKLNVPENYEKLKKGLILIGKNMFGAAVSVKPSIGDPFEFNSDGKRYKLYGITDMINKVSNSLETNIQALRICGLYPKRYILRLWMTEEDLSLLKEQIKINGELVRKYDKGPTSIEKYTTDLKFDLFSNSPYKKTICTLKLKEQTEEPEGIKLKTRVYKNVLTEEQIKEFRPKSMIKDFEGDIEEQNKLKNKIKMNMKRQDEEMKRQDEEMKRQDEEMKRQDEEMKRQDEEMKREEMKRQDDIPLPNNINKIKNFQVSYNKNRYESLIQNIFKNPQTNEWKIEFMVTGPNNENSKLEDCYVIQFEPIDHENRPTTRDEYQDQLQYSDQLQYDENQTYCFKTINDKWIIYCQNQDEMYEYTHRYLNKIEYNHDHKTEIQNLSSKYETRLLTSGCQGIIKSGKRKGEQCGKKCKVGDLCGSHSK
jgi:hypothetical protein